MEARGWARTVQQLMEEKVGWRRDGRRLEERRMQEDGVCGWRRETSRTEERGVGEVRA